MRSWMSWMSWIAVTPFAVWAAVRLSGFEPDWPWVPVVAFTPHAAVGAALALALAGLLRRWAAGAVALVTVLALGFAVLPRALPDPAPAGRGAPLRVLAANLLVGRADATDLAGLVRSLRPDVLTLQEFTPLAERRLEAAGLRELLPYAVTRPAEGAGGSAVYARHPLAAGELIESGGFGQATAVLKHPGGARVEIVSVHPCAPKRMGRLPCWLAGLDRLPRGGGRLRVLAGDFNATLDHLPLRELLAAGYRDAADAMGRGLSTTWGGWGPLPGVAIDHVLAGDRMEVRDFRVLAPVGSDHRPVYAELLLP
ncbi:endonuclease/exonuclease/phosphatase family protein [Actinomadura sp. ATCC 39365]